MSGLRGSRHGTTALQYWIEAFMGHNMVCDQRGGYCALNCNSDDWKQGCCRNISSSFGAPSWEHWDVCQDQLAERCLVISVGLGGSFFFEDGLAALGCEVHAFDPTISLRATHAAHARRRGWKFHFSGLVGGVDNVTSGLKNHYGALNNASMLSLREIVSIATGGASDRHVDVIKIDCEGCPHPPHTKLTVPCPLGQPCESQSVAIESSVAVVSGACFVRGQRPCRNFSELVKCCWSFT